MGLLVVTTAVVVVVVRARKERDRQHAHSIGSQAVFQSTIFHTIRTGEIVGNDEIDYSCDGHNNINSNRSNDQKRENAKRLDCMTNPQTHTLTNRIETNRESERLPLDVHRLSITPSLDVILNGCTA